MNNISKAVQNLSISKFFFCLFDCRSDTKAKATTIIYLNLKQMFRPRFMGNDYAFSTTKESIDIAREAFRKVKDLTIKLSMVENAAYRLASNIKKTQKRANALQNITIPMYSNLVYSITNALEEKEREEFTRLKVIKRMKEKKASG